jgi:Flp pilus assembly protein TadG
MRLIRDTAGALFVEHLIAFLPVMYFFLATWQLIELFATDLVVRRAANAAVRAAVVVLPDDPNAFGRDKAINTYSGMRREYVQTAAELILQAAGNVEDNVVVELSGNFSEHNPITAEVRVNFRCTASWVNIVCGGQPTRTLVARSTHAYQGARFSYDSI